MHPLAPLSLAGLLWYQGESNCLKGDAAVYVDKTRALAPGWPSPSKTKIPGLPGLR